MISNEKRWVLMGLEEPPPADTASNMAGSLRYFLTETKDEEEDPAIFDDMFCSMPDAGG